MWFAMGWIIVSSPPERAAKARDERKLMMNIGWSDPTNLRLRCASYDGWPLRHRDRNWY